MRNTSVAQRLMIRATAVALITWLSVAAVSLWSLPEDIEGELRSVAALAATLERISRTAPGDGKAWIASLKPGDQPLTPLRHVSLGLRDEQGRLVLQWRRARPDASWLTPLADWQRKHWGEPDIPPVVWSLRQAQGDPWTLTLLPDADSERHEALSQLATTLATMAAGTALLLMVLAWSVRRSLRPLRQLAAAITEIRPGHTEAARTLQPVKLREVDQVSAAVRSLALALDQAEADRRVLAQKLQAQVEAERTRLAQELHDEWGQRLTSLRLDAGWLQRKIPEPPEWAQACARMADQSASLLNDLRERLHSLAPRDLEAGDCQALHRALQDLVRGWTGRDGAAQLQFELRWSDQRAPAPPDADTAPLEADVLLAVYRLSQEGMTNVARHANATQATLGIRLSDDQIHWQLRDNGTGLPDGEAAIARGSGLASLRERAWSHGAELLMAPANPSTARPGLQLSVMLPLRNTLSARWPKDA